MNNRSAGFTLVEWVVTMAVVALLAGAIVPGLTARLAHARVRTAQKDVISIGKAIDRFYRDTGSWPARNAAGVNDQLSILLSGPVLATANPFGSTAFWSLMSAPTADVLDNHLYLNAPQGAVGSEYTRLGFVSWRGPYLEPVGPDPWGRPYVVNIGSAYSTSSTTERRLWVLSAGPDGTFQTSPTAGLGDRASGDDVGFLVRLR